jgi:hypothetical protein
MASTNETNYDKRIVARNIKRGVVTKEEYEQFLQNLSDASDKAVPIFSEEISQEEIDEDEVNEEPSE